MKVRRSMQNGARSEALRRVKVLESRCESLEKEVAALGLSERLRSAIQRIAELEDVIEAQRQTRQPNSK